MPCGFTASWIYSAIITIQLQLTILGYCAWKHWKNYTWSNSSLLIILTPFLVCFTLVLIVHVTHCPLWLSFLMFTPSCWVIHCPYYLRTNFEPRITQLAQTETELSVYTVCSLLQHSVGWLWQLIFKELVIVLKHPPSFYQPWHASWPCQKVLLISRMYGWPAMTSLQAGWMRGEGGILTLQVLNNII
jgi:hypothetical protein